MIPYCFVILENDKPRILRLHKDAVTPCEANPDPIDRIKSVYTVLSGDKPLSMYHAEQFILHISDNEEAER